ncbi:MAG: hypothetical protein WCI42_05675, partial [Verrucomicrobiota bacterium]
MSSSEPRFRRALIVVAAIHILLIGGLVWFLNRPVKKPSGQITWMETGSFSAPQESADEPVNEPKPKTEPLDDVIPDRVPDKT